MRLVPFLLCILLVLMSACSPIYYAPNTLNVPMIRAKGEGTASVLFGDRNSWNVQGAYSPAQNWSVMADGFRANDPPGTNSGGGSGHIISGGAGYYRPFNDHFMWDTYGILGFGRVENRFSSLDVSSSFVRYGLQPSAGFQSKFFDMFFSSRLVGLSYYNTKGSDPAEVQYLKTVGTQFLFEPAVTVRAGYKFIKVQAQVGHSHNVTDSSFKQDDDIASIGIVYTFKRK
jgi:hypothetical protein